MKLMSSLFYLLDLFVGFFVWQNICIYVEITKQNEKENRDGTGGFGRKLRLGAIRLHQGVETVTHNDPELNQLDDGDVLLPPQIRLRILGGLVVIRVHHNVDYNVEEAHEETVAAIAVIPQIQVTEIDHVNVMKHV